MQETAQGKLIKKVEWQHRLARFAVSGQPIKAFRQAESVSQASFYRWRKYMIETGAGAEGPATGASDCMLTDLSAVIPWWRKGNSGTWRDVE